MAINKYFGLLLIVALLTISFPMVSAYGEVADFNETDGDYGSYDIDSGWGFMPTWLGGGDKAWIKLNNNTDKCLINCRAELEGEFFEPRSLIDGIEFVDRQGKDVTGLKNLGFKIGQYQNVTYQDPIYEEVCENVTGNETNQTYESCYKNQTGSEARIEEEFIWRDYQGEEIEGYFRLEITAQKQKNLDVDWIIEVWGERLTSWAWWDSDWDYKREISVKENSGGSLTNYSVLFYINYTEDTSSNANVDFSDLRFLDSTETTELNYWFENVTNSSNAYVWVKIPSLTASINNTIYMYYGNAVATSNSDIKTTFHLGDDFEDGSLDTSIWDLYSTSLYSETGGRAIIGGAGSVPNGYNQIRSDINFTDYPYKLTFISADTTTSNYGGIGLATNYYNGGLYSHLSYNGADTTYKSRLGTEITIGSFSSNVYKKSEIIKFANGTIIVSVEGVGSQYNGNSPWTIGSHVNLADWTGDGGTINVEYIYMNGWVSAEPNYYIGAQQDNEGVATTLNHPTQNQNLSNSNVQFNFTSVPTGLNLSNATAYIWNATDNSLLISNFTNLTGDQTIKTTFANTLEDGLYKWNAQSCIANGECDFGNTNHSFRIDTNPPQVTITSPSGTYPYLEQNESLDLNWTIIDEGVGLDSCWFIYNNITTFINCTDNHTTFNYTQGVNSLTAYGNDTLGLTQSSVVNWSVVVDSYTQGVDKLIIGEGTDVTFNLTIDYSISHTGVAKLFINGDSYSPDNIVTISGQNFYEKTINMPDGYGNATGSYLDWYWNYNITDYSTDFNTTPDTLTVYAVEIDDCSSYGELILNMTLLDEEDLTELPGVNESSQVEIDLEISGVDNSSIMWQYSNTYYNETNPQVCIPLNILNYSNYKIDFTVGLEATDRVKEFYYLDNGTLDSTKNFNSYTNYNISLYDLLTVDSTTFLFNFFDKDGLTVDNAVVHTFRRYIGDGEFLEVERSKQDNNGETHMHLVEEDVIYRFMITQNGVIVYTSEEYNALCEALPCTITLTETGEFEPIPTDYSLINGTSYIVDNQTTRTSTYVYAMNSPSSVEYVLYKQNFNGTVTEIDSASSTSSAGTLSVDVPLHAGNISYFTAVYKEGQFVESQWVDMNDMDASNFFGSFLAVFLGFLIILALVLMSVTEKTGTIVAFLFGLIFTGALGLTKLTTSTGQNLIIYIVIAGGILIFKLSKKRT